MEETTCPLCGAETDMNDWFCSEGYCPDCCVENDSELPVVTVTPSSGWPESDLIYRGNIYRYVGNLTWQKEGPQ